MAAPGIADLATTWIAAPVVDAGVVLAGGLYLRAAAHARRPWPLRRSAAFLAGLGAIVVALQSGLGAYDDELLSVHMVQHLVLMLVAAPLLVAGAPLTVALRGSRRNVRRAVGRLLRSRVVQQLGRPVVALLVWSATIVLTHLTPFYGFAVQHEAVHDFEHALFLAVAVVFWWPIVAVDPAPHAAAPLGRFVQLLLGMLSSYLVGAILTSDSGVFYPVYAAPSLALGVNPHDDQQLAGALMLVGGNVLMACIAMVLAWRALTGEERRAQARERYADAGGRA